MQQFQQAKPAVELPLRMWRSGAVIAGAFLLLVGVVMLGGHLTSEPIDPLKSPELKELKDKLRLDPADDGLKQQIRALDLRQRQRFFHRLSLSGSGTYLLLGGAVVFLISFGQISHLTRRPPMPQPKGGSSQEPVSVNRFARWSVAGTGIGIGAILLLFAINFTSGLPKEQKNPSPRPGAPGNNDAASPEEMARNWPRFRGPNGSGISIFSNYPASWDAKTGARIAWKVPSPAPGYNSPIIWSNQVFLSGGDAQTRSVFCLNAANGETLWQRAVTNVPGTPAQPPEIPDSTGYAAGSMATDGRRVYAIFANGDVAAFTLDGKAVWSKSFGPLKNPYGYATSLATWQDRLLIQLDQGESEEGKSRLYALNGHTGQTVWQHPRNVGSSWATPIVIEAAGKTQVIALAVPWVASYSAADGTELWRVNALNGEITPSPVFAGGLVVVASPSEKLIAIRPDGQGDVSKTHVAWTNEDNVPDVTSPLSNGELVFAVTTSGVLSCFDARDGKKLWEHDFETEVHASPSLAGGRMYLFSQKGAAIVVEASRQFKELFRTEMGDNFHASPAFTSDSIILRGATNVWCIAEKTRR